MLSENVRTHTSYYQEKVTYYQSDETRQSGYCHQDQVWIRALKEPFMMQEDCSVLTSIKLLTSQKHFKMGILYFTQRERPSQTLKNVQLCSIIYV